MVPAYNHRLVGLSKVVAMLVSYTALRVASHVATAERRHARWWLATGAVAMGIGIWTMHFIGMLAMSLPVPLAYRIPTTVGSLLVAVVTSGFALTISSGTELTLRRLSGAAVVMGSGIARHRHGRPTLRPRRPLQRQCTSRPAMARGLHRIARAGVVGGDLDHGRLRLASAVAGPASRPESRGDQRTPAASGDARRSDRPAQPNIVPRAPQPGNQPVGAGSRQLCDPRRRSRPLQGHQ